MTNQNLQTLSYFAVVEIILGLWLLVPSFVISTFTISIGHYLSPIVLSLILIFGGFLNLIFTKHFTLYISFVSVPLILLGVIFFQAGLLANNISPGTILSVSMGVYSSIYAGQIFNKRISTVKTLVRRYILWK